MEELQPWDQLKRNSSTVDNSRRNLRLRNIVIHSNHEHCLGSFFYPNFFSRLSCCGLMSVKSTARKSSNSCWSIGRDLFPVRARFSFWTTITVRRTGQTVVTANTTSCPSRLSSASILAVTCLHANKHS